MKGKIAIGAVVVLLVLAQLIFGGKKTEPGTPEHARKVLGSGVVESIDSVPLSDSGQPDPMAETPPSPPPQRPKVEDVVAVWAGTGEGALRLERSGEKWNVVGAVSAPADENRVTALLSDLLDATFQGIPENERPVTGLENGSGLPVTLVAAGCDDYEMRIGLRPEGRYDAAYVSMPGGEVVVLSSDVRGRLGLWKNVPDAFPDSSAWAEKGIIRFNPDEAVRIEAVYPDHRIAFEKSHDGEWEQRSYVPGGEWDRQALEGWLRDVSSFRVSGAGGVGNLDKENQVRHHLAITLADGTEKTIWAAANHAGDGMVVESSDYPGHLFTLSDWRFRRYFRRLHRLFPEATPHFTLSDVRFIDIRQTGESVKIARRNNAWHLSSWPYPLRTETVERLVRMLSLWQPEDYATPDFKTIRPHFAGPMIEVSLADGRVHQYRLAGRHPIYPWRYVIVDNAAIFSITDPTVAVMFPALADVLDLGKTVSVQTVDDIREIRLEDEQKKQIAFLCHKEDGSWEGETDSGTVDTAEADISIIARKMVDWTPIGFYPLDSQATKPVQLYSLHVIDNDGTGQTIQFYESDGHHVPYSAEGHRAFLLERKAFFNWLGAIRALNDHLVPVETFSEAEVDDPIEAMESEKPETGSDEHSEATVLMDEKKSEGESATANDTNEDEESASLEPSQSINVGDEGEELPVPSDQDLTEPSSGYESGSPETGLETEQQTEDAPEPETDDFSGEPLSIAHDEMQESALPEESDGEPFQQEVENLHIPEAVIIHDSQVLEPELIVPPALPEEILILHALPPEEIPPSHVPFTEPQHAPDSDLVNSFAGVEEDS